MEVHLNGSADWQALWLKLVEAASENDLNALVLDVSASAGLERYHARWTRVASSTEALDQWKTVIPISLRGAVVGRLYVVGQRSSRPIGKQMILIADMIDDLEAGPSPVGCRQRNLTASTLSLSSTRIRKPFRKWAPASDLLSRSREGQLVRQQNAAWPDVSSGQAAANSLPRSFLFSSKFFAIPETSRDNRC